MKRKISILLVIALLLMLGVTAYAASSYTMTYKPGTTDTVTNMPQNNSGMGGDAYNVSSTVPQRAGYEFLGWELDFETAPSTITYSVRYISVLDGRVLGAKECIEIEADEYVEEIAVEFEGYVAIDPTYVFKTVIDGEVIYFYYLIDNFG